MSHIYVPSPLKIQWVHLCVSPSYVDVFVFATVITRESAAIVSQVIC